ncbi:hypothetical protein PHSY_001806 [Pseudozyma hubeiensis SY62]|uniref:Uncharacterized protein n=1 Tax=Pseudozyma hubeiensis (strain SY62) TaxID=1305764 RepID=R9P817_PSEHS|nr:hypothetical protein PHSY_001806 [Pseudozyma hubeiensis SY62]GAC94235.1 hypothetical protein PHSY_001806 [Pseudozyma hubeiensis SY62]
MPPVPLNGKAHVCRPITRSRIRGCVQLSTRTCIDVAEETAVTTRVSALQPPRTRVLRLRARCKAGHSFGEGWTIIDDVKRCSIFPPRSWCCPVTYTVCKAADCTMSRQGIGRVDAAAMLSSEPGDSCLSVAANFRNGAPCEIHCREPRRPCVGPFAERARCLGCMPMLFRLLVSSPLHLLDSHVDDASSGETRRSHSTEVSRHQPTRSQSLRLAGKRSTEASDQVHRLFLSSATDRAMTRYHLSSGQTLLSSLAA